MENMNTELAFILIFFAFVFGFALGLFAPVIVAKVCQICRIDLEIGSIGDDEEEDE